MSTTQRVPVSAFAQSAAQAPIVQPHHHATAAPSTGGAAQTVCAATSSDAADLAFSSFLASSHETFDSSALPSAVLSNMQLAGILGLLPQQPEASSPPPDEQPTNGPSHDQKPSTREGPVLKVEPECNDHGPQPSNGVGTAAGAPSVLEPHHSHPYQPEGMPGQSQHGRWLAPSAPAPWGYETSPNPHHASMVPPQSGSHQHQHPGGGVSTSTAHGTGADGQPSGAGQAPSNAAPTSSGPSAHPPGVHVGHMHMPHPGAMAMRGYPYGPYGEPVPYPPHARPPPGAYHHPGMPGPPPGHPAMMGYHPGYPHHHHLPPRSAYYPQDGRYPPMAPCHPGYPPPGYYRGYPGMPPHPHPAYMYMPPPYGPHPGMHPGMYHPSQGAPSGAPSQQPPEAHGRENSASGGSAGTTVGGAGSGSDGGSDPGTGAGVAQVLKAVVSSGAGAEGDDIGLEAVIVLRPGAQETEDGSLLPPDAAADGDADDAPCPEEQAVGLEEQQEQPAVDEPPMPDDGDDPATAPAAPPQHRVWPHMMPPPPHGMPGPMPGGGPYEWPPPPHPHAVMPGYPPHMHPAAGGWMYPYPHPHSHPHAHPHPMAAGAMHQQQLMLNGELGQDDAGSDGGAAPSDAHQPPRRRPSLSGIGSMGGNGGPMMVPPMPSSSQMGAAAAMPGAVPQQGPHFIPAPGMLGMPGRRPQGAGPQSVQPCVPMPMPLPVPPKVLSSPEDHMLLQRPGSADAELTRSGSIGQLFAAVGGFGDVTCNVSRRTQRLKKRRSAELLGPAGSTPDPFAAAMAAMGRDSSTGSGASGLLPMFLAPGSVGPGRRSSGGSGAALQSRVSLLPIGRQRSEPGYLIEGTEQGGGWGPGAGAMAGPVAGLGQLVHQPQHMLQQQQQEQAVLRRTENGSSGGSGRAINLPKRFEDAVITMEYPKGPQPAFVPQRVPGKTVPPHMLPHGFQGAAAAGLSFEQDAAQAQPADDLQLPLEQQEHPFHQFAQFQKQQLYHHYQQQQQHQQQYADEYADDDADDAEDEREGGRHGRHAEDSDEDYVVGRGYRATWGGGGEAGEGAGKKRKAPMAREEPAQPEKKRKARDPATISKVVLNCVIILRMVNHDVAYEKEIRCALGNNPDTSKALRLLITQGKLVRTGQGGRGNPFCYRCTPLGITTLQRIEAAATPGADPSEGPNKEQRAAAVAV